MKLRYVFIFDLFNSESNDKYYAEFFEKKFTDPTHDTQMT